MRVRFHSMEAYRRNYVRKQLLELASDDDPRPIILSGRYIPYVRRDKRFLIYTIKPFAKEYQDKRLLQIADHLWIKATTADVWQVLDEYAKKGESTPRIYLVGYPAPYKSESIERCGFRLAFDVARMPIYFSSEDIPQDVIAQCRFPDVSQYVRVAEDEAIPPEDATKYFSSIEKYQKNYLRTELLQFVGETEGMPIVLAGRVLFKKQEGNSSIKVGGVRLFSQCIRYRDMEALTSNLEIEGDPQALIEAAEQGGWEHHAVILMVGYPEPVTVSGVTCCGFRLAYDVITEPIILVDFQKQWIGKITKDLRQACFWPDTKEYVKKRAVPIRFLEQYVTRPHHRRRKSPAET